MTDDAQLLQIEALVTGYGKKRVLNQVSIDMSPGEIVALIGHNGAGKSTLLKAVFGILPIWSGSITFDGRRLEEHSPRTLLRAGVAYVPQGNRVFGDLTVQQNLELGGLMLSNRTDVKERIHRVVSLFPDIEPRLHLRAGSLSGGEKQMLALANVLILSPRLLLLDEPSLGLAPALVTQALRQIHLISRELGAAVLLVEQKVRAAVKTAERVYVLRNGRVSYSGCSETLHDEAKLREVYL